MFKSNTHGRRSLKQKLFQTITFASIGVLLTVSLMAFRQGQVQGAPSTTLNFQARLLNKTGSLVADGDYHVEFKIYNHATLGAQAQGTCSGNCEWMETRTGGSVVTVKNGFLSVNLGSVTAFSSSINWDEEHWLTMNIGGAGGSASWDGEMAPRIKLTAVPYAFQAGQLAKTETDGNRGTLSFDTLSANRSILLPDEAGTLCIQNSANCGFVQGSGTAFLLDGNTVTSTAVLGTNSSHDLAFETAGTTRLTVDTSGNVGIGIASPDARLHVQGEASQSGTGTLTTSTTTSRTVTGTGSSFNTQLSVGDTITASSQTRTITAIASATSMTVDAPFSPVLSSATFTYKRPQLSLTNSSGTTFLRISDVGTAASVTGDVDFNGHIALGNNQTPHSQYVLRLNETFGSGAACGFFGCFGIESKITVDNPSSPTTAVAIGSQVSVTGNTTLTNGYGLLVSGASVEAGSSITNNYGVFVGTQTGGATDYGLYMDGADDYGIYLNYGAAFGLSTPNYGLYVENADTYAIHVDAGATRLDGTLELQTLGTANTDEYLCRNSSNVLSTCSNAPLTSATAFVQGGNSFGSTPAVLGTNNASNLELETAGVTRLTLDQTGNASLTGNLGIGTAASTAALEVNGNIYLSKESARTIKVADSTTAATAGAALSILGANGVSATGGAITVQGGTATGTGDQIGGAVTIKGGAGYLLGTGGLLTLSGGDSNFAGGAVAITGGSGGVFGGGAVTIGAGNSAGTNATAATTTIHGGRATGSGTGGSIIFQTSDALASGSTLQSLSTKAILQANGNFGIGDNTPAALFTVGNGDLFQVNSGGAIAAATGITSSGTITFSGLDCSANANGGAITANASGVLSCSDDNDTAASITLQTAYDSGNTITTTDNKNIGFTLADTTTDSDFIVNMQGTGNTFEIQNGGTAFATFSQANGGKFLFQPTTNGANDNFNIKSFAGNNMFTADTSTGRVGINLGGTLTPTLSSGGLEVRGGVRINGGTAELDTYSSPEGVGFGTRLNIPNAKIEGGNTGIALGILQNDTNNNSNAMAITVFDQRTLTSNRPAIGLFSQNEDDILGFSWEGQSTTGYVKTMTGNVGIRSGTTNIATFGASAISLLQNTSITGNLDSSGSLTAGTGDAFQVNSSGAIAAATGITSSGAITFSGLDCSANANGGAITASATGVLSCTDDNDTTANAFLQSGNSFAATAVLGTNDNNSLAFETNNITRLTVDTSGNATLTGRMTAQGGLSVTGGTVNLNSSSNFNTSINTGTSTGLVAIGNTSGTPSVSIDTAASGTVAINTGASGTINIGSSAAARTINIGTGGADQTIAIGNTSTNSGVTLNSGVNGINLFTNGTSNVGTIVRSITNTSTAFRIQTASAGDTLLQADTSNNRVYIGDADIDTTLLIVDRVATANLPAAGITLDGGIVYDATTDKFKIYEGGQIKELCNMTDLGCGAGATVSLQDAYNNSPSPATIATSSNTKDIVFKAGTGFDADSTFQIQNASGQTLLVADTLNQRMAIGPAAVPANGVLTVGTNTTASSGGIFFGTDTNLFRAGASSLRTNDAFTVDGLLTGSAGATISGAAISLNTSSNFNTNFNTGSSTGDVTIGNDSASVDLTLASGGTINIGTGNVARTVNIATGAAAQTLTIGSTNTTSSTLIQGGTGNITLTANGSSNTGTLVNNTNNSTNAFRIQSSGSDTLFRADTTNNKVYVGNATAAASTDTTLLVVDSAVTSNIPTTSVDNGSIVYDSTLNKLKVYENGAWKVLCNTTDAGCGASGASQDLQEAYDNSTSPATISTSSSTKNVIIKSGSGFNSTSMFMLQSDGDTLFTTDTSNNRLYVGDATGITGSANTLFVLDRAQDTDYLPTGVNGGMIYDAEANKFKVYENGAWKTLCNQTDLGCGSAGVAQSLQDAYNNSSSPATIATTSSTKDIIFKAGIGFDAASMFQIQAANGDELLVADTLNFRVSIGSNTTPANSVLTVGTDTTTATGGIYFGTDTNLYRIAANHLRTDGSIQLGEGANRTFDVQGRTTNAAGNGLTISAGDAGAGASAFSGGALNLQGGDAAGTGNANGGDVILTGGAGVGTGAKGLVVISTPTFTTATTQNCAANCTITQANVDGNGAVVANATAIELEVTLPDPTNTTAGRIVYVTAGDTSNDFTLLVNGGGTGNEIAMRENTTATMVWNGADWTAAGASSSTTLQAAYDNTLTSAGGAEIVLSAPGGNADGLTIRNNSTSPIVGGVLEVQSSIGTNLFSVNNLGTELAANGGSETSSAWGTNWGAAGGASVSRTTTSGEYVTGLAGVEVTTTAAASDGIKNNLSGNPVASTTYQVSFAAKLSSGTFSTVQVVYSRDGGTDFETCANYSTQTLVTTDWTKVTCTITTDATAATSPEVYIRQTDATARTFWIDNLSFMRNDSTTEPSNVQIGGGINGGPITLFTLDRSSAPPVEDGNETYLGSMYYDTVTGRIQCYESDGWGACGSAPDNFVNLIPEYAGAVLNGAGVGTMTADFCANQSGTLQKNTSLCDTGQALNFYHWTSPQANEQEYSIYVTYKLPAAFKSFLDNNTVSLMGRTDNVTNGEVSYEMFRSEGGTLYRCYDGSNERTVVTQSANTWWTVPINGNEAATSGTGACGFSSNSADQNIIFKINVKAKSNANVYVGTLSFTTVGQ